ncbi:pantoate--beta-alanine ligase [Bacillus luteolus]|uniref:Pantothenate synthetase n=1 Tax=Litchfieldia luteola TaxID=682179 RepID=A0ABR9QP19_9BACI|nr:pantoate--beta-alanine ligase [Cytobacillus luteolus]MBE4910255.1 pantoate--beta-alanine ligase [Cytobacillus luteolus]MBP1942173.1 pantoate--beta-alanine ligase [Cytobacillus luteolus]
MIVVEAIKEIQEKVSEFRLQGKSIGFVPTMGYLHEGHLSLMEQARKENDIVVLSIFVNPLQFGPNEDFDSYPRNIDRDEDLARNAGVDLLFYPTTSEMYPHKKLSVSVKVNERVDVLCGKQRSGHFDGVATVVTKLFNIVLPHKVYFGMKDAQQVAVIDGLIQDLNIPVELVPLETIREEDGLAKSSRNVYLTKKERKEAAKLYEGLNLAKEAVRNGVSDPEIVKKIVVEHITNETSGKIDYVELYSYPELETISVISGKVIIALAVKFTKARLIDNITFVV